MKKLVLFTILLLIFSNKVFSQTLLAEEKRANLIKIAQSGDSVAQFQLYQSFIGESDNLKRDTLLAIQWLVKSAKAGYPKAQTYLGYCYDEGIGVDKNTNVALDWYQKAAKLGDGEAQFIIGTCYKIGYGGMEMNYFKAAEWYEKAAAQNIENAIKQFSETALVIGNNYQEKKDYKNASKWFLKSAEKGNAQAQFNIGFCYLNGDGVEMDTKQSAYWHEKAAQQGHAGSQYVLGLYNEKGHATEKDIEKAVYWYTKSAEQGERYAQTALAICYTDGTGVTQNEEKAVYWYSKAAEQGDPEAQKRLAACYACGFGVPIDKEQMIYWLEKSAKQGYANAQLDLGYCYEAGEGVSQDYSKAFQWYTKSADQGNAMAQNNLGIFYYNGTGVVQNTEKAVSWLKKAAAQGFAQAKTNLDIIEAQQAAQRDLANSTPTTSYKTNSAKTKKRNGWAIAATILQGLSDGLNTYNQVTNAYQTQSPSTNRTSYQSQQSNNNNGGGVTSCSHQQQRYNNEAENVKRWMASYKDRYVTYLQDKAAGKTGPLYDLKTTDVFKQIQQHQSNMRNCRKICPSIHQSELENITPKAYIRKTWSIDVP